ncbi:glutamate--tRNA ligase [bacterium NHP-B]|nr:glutamate--tRNA ligase [bacterium NHP-B]
MTVRTRFAPSPTGALHLGGARTALFNWLYAKHEGGTFCVRIEDTDQKRSSQEALASITQGLSWLGLTPDEPMVFQSQQQTRHQEVAMGLLAAGHAYWCDMDGEALASLKAQARLDGRAPLYLGRDTPQPRSSSSVLRFKMPRTGEISFTDQVHGQIRVNNHQLDDLVLLRADGSPTYMLSVVVDDHDMRISHVIRGADHISNTPKQLHIYEALSWSCPSFAHIPLIHGADGAKLSKRHGALDVNTYKEEGFLKEALINALLRLGWGHKDQEIFSLREAVALFSLAHVGASPARFDPGKLASLNAHYLKALSPEALMEACVPFLSVPPASPLVSDRLMKGLPALAVRAHTLKDLAESAHFYTHEGPFSVDAHALPEAFVRHLPRYVDQLIQQDVWTAASLESLTRSFAEEHDLKLVTMAQPLRLLITGRSVSPPLFEVMSIVGKKACLARLAYSQKG